jgi:hypothetical protein
MMPQQIQVGYLADILQPGKIFVNDAVRELRAATVDGTARSPSGTAPGIRQRPEAA